VSRFYSHFFVHESSMGVRILIIILMAILAHMAVKLIRHISEWLLTRGRGQNGPLGIVTHQPKFATVTRLIVSGIAFIIYFMAIGLILQEFGFSLTAYLASASVVGLAISFGSQGLVQDIVIGLTLIFWDAMDVNDIVEIGGPTTNVVGRVDEIGMRFTKLVNFYNQKVFIPNRTIGNVSRFPHGGVDAYADPQIPIGADQQQVAKPLKYRGRDVDPIRRNHPRRAHHRQSGDRARRQLEFCPRAFQNLAGPGKPDRKHLSTGGGQGDEGL